MEILHLLLNCINISAVYFVIYYLGLILHIAESILIDYSSYTLIHHKQLPDMVRVHDWVGIGNIPICASLMTHAWLICLSFEFLSQTLYWHLQSSLKDEFSHQKWSDYVQPCIAHQNVSHFLTSRLPTWLIWTCHIVSKLSIRDTTTTSFHGAVEQFGFFFLLCCVSLSNSDQTKWQIYASPDNTDVCLQRDMVRLLQLADRFKWTPSRPQ